MLVTLVLWLDFSNIGNNEELIGWHCTGMKIIENMSKICPTNPTSQRPPAFSWWDQSHHYLIWCCCSSPIMSFTAHYWKIVIMMCHDLPKRIDTHATVIWIPFQETSNLNISSVQAISTIITLQLFNWSLKLDKLCQNGNLLTFASCTYNDLSQSLGRACRTCRLELLVNVPLHHQLHGGPEKQIQVEYDPSSKEEPI